MINSTSQFKGIIMYINREKATKLSIISVVFVFCIAIIALIFNGIGQFKTSSQLATSNQVTQLSHMLVRQQANLFSLMLAKNAKIEELSEALDNFAQEEFVLDANLYATNGTLLATSHNAFPLKPNMTKDNNSQQIVEPIFIQQDLAGFLRITFNTEYSKNSYSKVDELFHLLYGKLVALFLTGCLFMSCFFVFRRKIIHIPSNTQKSLKTNERKQTVRFHSRRRAFRRK